MPIESTVPVGGQQDPVIPVVQPSKEEATKADTIKVWTGRFSKSEAFLKPYFERDQQAFEFWYMWREFRGPYRANIFPPDVHAGVESITPRLTKGRAKVIVKSRGGIEGEHLLRVQRAHDAYWDKMGMDGKFETIIKRGTWFGFGVEKVTPKVEGHEEPIMQDVLDQFGEPTGQQQPVIGPDGKPQTRFVVDYAGPAVEVCDPGRVFFPRGYPTDEELPWVLFQYFKKKSELDESIYDADALGRLTASKSLPNDLTLDRDKVHVIPRKSQVQGQQNEDNLGVATPDLTNQEDENDDPTIELWEIWERSCKKYPKGRLLSIGNRVETLRDKANPMPEDELPINAFRYIEDTFNYRGIGVAREMERLVLERADKRNQRMDNVSRIVDGMTVLQTDEPIEDGELTHRPSGVIRLKDMANMRRDVQPDVTQNAYQEDNILQQDIAKATGAGELVLSGGPRSARTLGEADLIASSSNERYDGVIRRAERFLNRHARLVHLIVQQTLVESQHMDWTDSQGESQSDEINPQDFQNVSPDQVRYDAKSVIAYKEVARQQGMQLMEMLGKILDSDPKKFRALKPVLLPLMELYDEIKVQPKELMDAIEAYIQDKEKSMTEAPPPVDPTKVLSAVADIMRINPLAVSPEQLQAAFQMVGLPPAGVPEPALPPEGAIEPPMPQEDQVSTVPVTDNAPDQSQIIASASKIQPI